MMKKILLALMVFCSLLCVASCQGEKEPTKPERTEFDVPTEDGYFLYIDEEGTEYEGFFVDGLYEGYGRITYLSSTTYEGTFSEGKWNGQGLINWDSGCIYIGETKDDAMHGRGYMKWPVGDYYYGEWRYGSPNGIGTKYFKVGEGADISYNVYQGNMVNGLMEGYGTMLYFFGGSYTGDWYQNIRSGQGTYVWENNDDIPWIKYVGEFADDDIRGQGTVYFKDGTSYTGTFDGTDSLPTSSVQ